MRRRVMGGGDRFNGHQYVDLHLPSGTLWATENLSYKVFNSNGTYNIPDRGYFYQYGKGNRYYDQTAGEAVYTGTENPLSLSLDPAQQSWGGEWHVPTKEQFEELMQYFDSLGDSGFAFGGNNDQYIILPVSGYIYNRNILDDGITGYYMTSSPNQNKFYTFYMDAVSEYCDITSSIRTVGVTVRPVVG